MDEIYLTQEGYDKLFQELEHLKKVKRRELSKRVAEARAQGDLSENAEYDAAKEAQALLERKVSELEEKLAKAQIISKDDISLDKVNIGVKVHLQDLETKEEFYYTILSDEEADFEKDQIGVNSPVAKGLLGKKKGEEAEIQAPRGIFRYKVLDISLP
ncbi:MAG: transcription elongation factor GreA [Candidatus Omnitrophica bacterium]|nr:transcription elongation factor GreA [Candidatus Omnitrophota bacterium]